MVSDTPDIFLSHSSKDDAFVDRIYDALTKAGLSVWCDHKVLQAGDDWDEEIQKALNSCKAALLALSPQSAASKEVTVEWRTIISLGKRLYVALIENVPQKIFPYRLTIENYVKLNTDFDTGMASLLNAITNKRALLDDDPATDSSIHLSGQFPRIQLDLPLIGRDREMQKIWDAFGANKRVTAILGFGGVGKTRLAAEIAITATDFRDGVIWHRIDSLATPQKLIQQAREHLDLPPMEDDPTWEELGKRQVLLILDNAEDCAMPEAYIQRLNTLNTDGGTRVLMTSRHLWNRLSAERINLKAPDHDAAVEILKEMIGREKPDFSLAGHEDELAQKAQHHPRLMEYAVGWANSFPANRVIEMLTTLKGDDPQAALEDLVQKTIAQMDNPVAVEALRRLAVFRGGFTWEAAQAVLDENQIGTISTLKRWNLLRVEDERYVEIDPLVVHVVGEDDGVKQAHFEYYYELAEDHTERQDYAGLDVESANLEAAFEWMIERGDYEAAFWFYNACSDFLPNRGRFDQTMDWILRVAGSLGEVMDNDHLAGAVQNSLGNVYQMHPTGNRLDNLRRAIQAYESALQYDSSENYTFALIQNNLGTTYKSSAAIQDREANLRRAIQAFETALHYYTLVRSPLGYAMIQNNLGISYADLAEIEDREKNLQRAIRAYQAALDFYTPDSAPLDYAMTQNNLGNAYHKLATIDVEDSEANLRRAIQAFETALHYYTPDSAPLDYAMTQNNLGAVYGYLATIVEQEQNLRRAIQAYDTALQHSTPSNTPLYYAKTHAGLGLVYRKLGDIQKAIECWGDAENYFRQMGHVEYADLMQQFIDEALKDDTE